MHLAANQGAAEIVQLLVDERAAMDCKDENSETPLFLAAEKNHISCVEILLKKQVQICILMLMYTNFERVYKTKVIVKIFPNEKCSN